MKTDVQSMIGVLEVQTQAIKRRMSTAGVIQAGAPSPQECFAMVLANQVAIMGGLATILRVFDESVVEFEEEKMN